MFSKSVYLERRKKLKEKVGSGVVLLLGNDNSPIETYAHNYPFRQESSFLYYSGVNQITSLSLLIDIDNDREIIFGDDISLEDQMWTGRVESLGRVAERFGIKEVSQTAFLQNYLSKVIAEKREIHYLPTCRSNLMLKLENLLKIPARDVNKHASAKLIIAIISQRECKTNEEVSEIEDAIKVSSEVYSMLRREIAPGRTERELLAKCNAVLGTNGNIASFPTILTVNSSILHNWKSDKTLKKVDLLLVDSGVMSNGGYASDITRTYPVSRFFTLQQKNIYDIVLMAQSSAIESIRPGVFYKDIHLQAAKTITKGLIDVGLMKGNAEDAVSVGAHALFFPHGLGHMLGMDVHDMEILGEENVGYDNEVQRSSQFGISFLRLARKLKKGFVLTVEPGIYFIEDLINVWKTEYRHKDFINYEELEKYRHFEGIRIEDDVLVTENGSRVLSQCIPKAIEKIDKGKG